ncbi:Uncharacterised protein [Moraxella bovis]|uniref:Uncharacterized protein n=1 Tax=Moraxella bovis TaxID=476 RepID=A0A378PZP7_MORBO|nr:Uncharacterised protein [Moraxella bovis]
MQKRLVFLKYVYIVNSVIKGRHPLTKSYLYFAQFTSFCKKFAQNSKKYLQNIRTYVHYAPDDNTNFCVSDFNNNADDCH